MRNRTQTELKDNAGMRIQLNIHNKHKTYSTQTSYKTALFGCLCFGEHVMIAKNVVWVGSSLGYTTVQKFISRNNIFIQQGCIKLIKMTINMYFTNIYISYKCRFF